MSVVYLSKPSFITILSIYTQANIPKPHEDTGFSWLEYRKTFSL